MLRLLDSRTNSYAEVAPARRGLLRVCAYAPGDAEGFGITGLRVELVADLLARAAEMCGLQVITVFASREHSRGQAPASRRDAEALGIHPPTAYTSSHEAQAVLGGPIDVHLVSSHDADESFGRSGVVVPVGAAHIPGYGDHGDTSAGTVPAGQGHDPLAFRLALLSVPYHEPADLTESVLARAYETLRRWRQQVAGWAESPSRPIPADIGQQAQAAFGGLDIVSVLTMLGGLAHDAGVSAGAKFEAFVYADRILGLDLARDIGKLGG